MNKTDVINALAREVAISEREAKGIIKTILEAMTTALVCCEPIEIRGLGRFTDKQYKSYESRNPKTGKKAIAKPKKLSFFKSSMPNYYTFVVNTECILCG